MSGTRFVSKKPANPTMVFAGCGIIVAGVFAAMATKYGQASPFRKYGAEASYAQSEPVAEK